MLTHTRPSSTSKSPNFTTNLTRWRTPRHITAEWWKLAERIVSTVAPTSAGLAAWLLGFLAAWLIWFYRSGKDITEYARSAVYVARYQLLGGGDLDLARDYLTAIAQSNSEEVGQASELLKSIAEISTRANVARPAIERDVSVAV
jgi:hypothetical protein